MEIEIHLVGQKPDDPSVDIELPAPTIHVACCSDATNTLCAAWEHPHLRACVLALRLDTKARRLSVGGHIVLLVNVTAPNDPSARRSGHLVVVATNLAHSVRSRVVGVVARSADRDLVVVVDARRKVALAATLLALLLATLLTAVLATLLVLLLAACAAAQHGGRLRVVLQLVLLLLVGVHHGDAVMLVEQEHIADNLGHLLHALEDVVEAPFQAKADARDPEVLEEDEEGEGVDSEAPGLVDVAKEDGEAEEDAHREGFEDHVEDNVLYAKEELSDMRNHVYGRGAGRRA